MGKSLQFDRLLPVFVLSMLAIGTISCQLATVDAASEQSQQSQDPSPEAQQTPPSESSVVIETPSELVETYPRANYEFQFQAHGGVPTLHWKLEKGALPPGLRLEENGLLRGQPERTGDFNFTLSVHDSNNPPKSVQKGFVLRVHAALSLVWKTVAHVSGSRIEGSVAVSNTTGDDLDLTFVVMAVAPNGRATAIGYQHYDLRPGTIGMELPFGETLPHGEYVVHVDAVGEMAPKNLIYRQRLQTPAPLQIAVGP
jgi:hypothetical protein